MADEYTNRELYMLIKGNQETNQLQHDAILDSLKSFHETTNCTLDRLLIQTTKTNGRVTNLEGWKSYIAGGTALFCMIVLPLLWILVNEVRANSSDIITIKTQLEK